MTTQGGIRETTYPSGVVVRIRDTRKGRRHSAEVFDCASSGYNVRIDKQGKPFKCLRGIQAKGPMAAYEICLRDGVKWDTKRECWEDE